MAALKFLIDFFIEKEFEKLRVLKVGASEEIL